MRTFRLCKLEAKPTTLPAHPGTTVQDCWWTSTSSGKSSFFRSQHNTFSLVWFACKTRLARMLRCPSGSDIRTVSSPMQAVARVLNPRNERRVIPALAIMPSTPIARTWRNATGELWSVFLKERPHITPVRGVSSSETWHDGLSRSSSFQADV